MSISRSTIRQAAATLLTSAALALVSLCASSAQNPRQIAQITQALPAAAQQTITRLGTFSMLPAQDWHYHAGDLPHGEAVDLNDLCPSRISRSCLEPEWFSYQPF